MPGRSGCVQGSLTRQLGEGNRTVRKIITGLFTTVLIVGMSALAWKACAAEEPAQQTEAAPGGETAPGGEKASGGGECCKAGDTTPPLDLIAATPKGGLHNPYNDQIDALKDEGH